MKKLSQKIQITILLIVIIISSLTISLLYKNIEPKTMKSNNVKVNEKSQQVNNITVDDLKNMNYPNDLVEYVEKYPETLTFVYNYKENSSKYNALTIDISKEIEKGKFPVFLQWDYRWGYRDFGLGYFAPRGCGPTCMAIIYGGLTGETKYNPYSLGLWARENNYYRDGSGTINDFFISGASLLGLEAKQLRKDKDTVIKHLNDGYVFIFNVKQGDFTTGGHYIVITGLSDDNKLIINDPNSITNSQKKWDIDRVLNQTKAIFAYKK